MNKSTNFLHFPIAVYSRFRSRWLFYREKIRTPWAAEDISELENMISDIMFLGLFFMIDGCLMERCCDRHGDCYVPENKIKKP